MPPTAPSVRPLFRLTVRMLLPLPGSSGYQSEQIPTSRPAAAIPGIRSHYFIIISGRVEPWRG